MSFPDELKEKLLLWCDRRCCLCKKGSDLLIQVHHIVPQADGGGDDEDNAMPLCFDCHGKVHLASHSGGTMFKTNELKKRRNQVYDECTRHLVPILRYHVHQTNLQLPWVGFTLSHDGNAPSVKAIVKLDTYVNGQSADNPNAYGLYRGQLLWHLNPGEGVNGLFEISQEALQEGAFVRVGVNITIFDAYDRPHKLLPVAYGLLPDRKGWFLDPIDPKESATHKC